MDTKDTSLTLDTHRLSRRGYKTDYKQKLEREPAHRGTLPDAPAPAVPSLFAELVRALVGHAGVTGVAFQCVAVAALRMLDRVHYRERQAAESAISLAQRQKLAYMIKEVEDTAGALRETLSAQGAKALHGHSPARHAGDAREHSWWYALSEAIQVLNEGAAWIQSVAAGQPQGSPTHTISCLLARMLQQHHDHLLAEAAQWMD